MDRNKKQMFNEMLQEVLLKRITDIKHLEKKSNYKLEDWEELFGLIREQGNKLANKQSEKDFTLNLAKVVGEEIDIDLDTMILIGVGPNPDNGKTFDFIALKGNTQNAMMTISSMMQRDHDFEQIILGSLFMFHELDKRLNHNTDEQ